MNNLLASAYKYISNGICVIPTNNQKIPVIPWKIYQDELITMEAAETAFELPYADFLGVVCGKASKNLEVIDVDTKYDLTGELFSGFVQDIKDNDPQLFDILLIIKTQSGGYHIYYHCETIEGNQKLAQRLSTPEELTLNPGDKIKVLIETRGQGGYVVAPPSTGYKIIQGDNIPIIAPEQRDMLLELARTYNQIIEEPKREYSTASHNPKEFFTTPWDDYNSRGDIVPILEKHGWQVIKETPLRLQFRRPGKTIGISGDYHKEKRLFKVFTTSSLFDVGMGYSHYRVFKVLECDNDPHLAAKRLLQMGYGEKRIYYGEKIERDLYKKKQEGLDNEQLINLLIAKGKSGEEAKEIVDNLSKVWGEKLLTFWDIKDNGVVDINRTKLIDFLHLHGGFSLFYYDKNSCIYRVVQCRDGLLQEASSEYMKKFIMEYIDTLPDTFDAGITPDDLKELLLKRHDTYFSNGLLEFLPRSNYNLLRDEVDAAYFPFKAGVIKVTPESVQILTYKEVNKVVWKTQIIDFDIKIDENINDKKIEYADFINCISGNDPVRYEYACTLVGYLLHKYKDPAKPYCVILAEENDNETKGGGTGKGIFLTAISKLINTERVDGKNFKLDKNFAFQRVGLDTRLIAIEDTRKNVDFEGFYSIITEGITVEKKNKDELFIAYRDSPKIVFTTNYTIINSSAHHKRRQKTFEFSDFFGAEKTPVHHFGHNLFEDWDNTEWNLFYNFFFECCSGYLKHGVLETVGVMKAKRKHVRLKYGEEFLEWFDEYIKEDANDWKFLSDLYDDFLSFSGNDKKFFSQKRFVQGIGEAVLMLFSVDTTPDTILTYSVQKRRKTLTGKRTEVMILTTTHHEK